jgi:transposase-like protein
VATAASYVGFRFLAEIISHAVWLYYRFALSFRDVSELMLARGGGLPRDHPAVDPEVRADLRQRAAPPSAAPRR